MVYAEGDAGPLYLTPEQRVDKSATTLTEIPLASIVGTRIH